MRFIPPDYISHTMHYPHCTASLLRITLILSVLLLCTTRQLAQHVVFGERSEESNQRGIYIDAGGMVYPDYRIADSDLEENEGSLARWYGTHPLEFLEIADRYGCHFDGWSANNAAILNDSVIARQIERIASLYDKVNTVSFLVHGFRKPFYPTTGGRPSPADFTEMKELINQASSKTHAFVEVYWDGMYGCCFSTNAKKNKALFRIFEEAQRNANEVGKTLRKFISGVPHDTVQVFSHSLGARVISTALFNLAPCSSRVPVNKSVAICMIAPAISPEDITQHYYNRPGMDTLRNRDNYKLAIVFNEKDFVLRKKDAAIGLLGPGPYRYGNTSLGCNHRKSVEKLLIYFNKNYRLSPVHAFNFESVGKCHHVYCYCREEKFKEVMKFLEE